MTAAHFVCKGIRNRAMFLSSRVACLPLTLTLTVFIILILIFIVFILSLTLALTLTLTLFVTLAECCHIVALEGWQSLV